MRDLMVAVEDKKLPSLWKSYARNNGWGDMFTGFTKAWFPLVELSFIYRNSIVDRLYVVYSFSIYYTR